MPDELVAQSVDTLVESGELVRERVAGCDGCYLARLHEAEAYTAERLLAMAQNEYRRMPDTEKIAAQIEAQLGLTFAEQQKETLRLACQHQVIAITGGPGTGKTTSIRAILALFDVLKLDTQLAAPTGRAAKRMSELTGRSAQTIHRLLEAGMSDDHQDIAFRRDEDDPLACDAVILDECSMVDISLMCALLRAMRPDCRLILVGDADQLPSVGPGNVFFGYHPQRRHPDRAPDGDLPPGRREQHRRLRARHQPRRSPAANKKQRGLFLPPAYRSAESGRYRSWSCAKHACRII